jgi:phage terminase large subunit-like protein
MVRADPELTDLLHIQEHTRTITHRRTGAVLKVVAADTETVGGKKAAFVLVDELWIFGKRANADAMLREATGGLVAARRLRDLPLTQSDEPPAGVFKAKLDYFRDVRDGVIVDPKSLGVLYEYPEDMIEAEAYLDPANFYITNPNLGRSVRRRVARRRAREGPARRRRAADLPLQAPQRRDRPEAAQRPLGRRRLLGSATEPGPDAGRAARALRRRRGRHRRRRPRRPSRPGRHRPREGHPPLAVLVPRLGPPRRAQAAQGDRPCCTDFEKAGELTICDHAHPGPRGGRRDRRARSAIAGLLPEKAGVGLDPVCVAAMVDALAEKKIDGEQLVAIPQGYKLNGAIWGLERKLKDGTA